MNQKEETVLDINIKGNTLSQVLNAFLMSAFKFKLPITIWNLPHSKSIEVLVSLHRAIPMERVDLENSSKGFVFSPFDLDKQKPLFVQGDLHFSFDKEVDFHQIDKSDSSKEVHSFLNSVHEFVQNPDSDLNYYIQKQPSFAQFDNYQNTVSKGVKAIMNSEFQKVVPARTKEIKLKPDFDLSLSFLKLMDAYPNAFVSLVSIPEAGTWLGATPELLLDVNQDIFKTVALAGTQKKDELKGINETAWTQKEIEEQAMVSRYIVDCFKKIRLRDFKEKGPRTVVAGNLLHLKTEFEVNMKETNFPELGTVMLELLHPTSAIAGMPKEPALKFIHSNEGFDRSFYSGFLGPINIENRSSLFVNLRCMQVLKNKAILYAGAGVTEDSDPKKELEETDMKFNTLLNILNSDH